MTALERITEWAELADTCAVCGDARRHHVFGSVCPGWRPSAPGALADAAVPAMAAALTAVLAAEGPNATGDYSEFATGYHAALDGIRGEINAAIETALAVTP